MYPFRPNHLHNSTIQLFHVAPFVLALVAAAPAPQVASLTAGQGSKALAEGQDVAVAVFNPNPTLNATRSGPLIEVPLSSAAAKPSPSKTLSIVPTNLAKPSGLPIGNGGPSVKSAGGLSFFAADPSKGGPGQNAATYTCFSGPASKFPPFSAWVPFETMFKRNEAAMLAVESAAIVKNIHDSILKISAAGKVDARLVLAQVMQESTGNVNVPCTNNGVLNCGLMQAFTGSVSFNPADPAKSVEQMIKDGTQGTAVAPFGGMVQAIDDPGTSGNVYIALRKYNSGKANLLNLSDPMGATVSYVSDMANRVLGWDARDFTVRNKCGFKK